MVPFPPGCIPISDGSIVPKTEARLAAQLRRRGVWTREVNGRHWMHVGGFVWQPVHWLARLPVGEVAKPHLLCLGFSSTLMPEQRQAANGSVPVHLLGEGDLASYDEKSLNSERRRQLRRARERAMYAQVVDVAAHIERLYAIAQSTLARVGKRQVPAFSTFRSGLLRRVQDDRDCLVVGLVEGEIAAYRLLVPVEDVVYFAQTMADTAYLKTHVGVGLYFESAQLARRCNGTRYLVSGLHIPNLESLTSFKESMGFQVASWPARNWVSPLLRRYLEWRAPDKLYRITGRR